MLSESTLSALAKAPSHWLFRGFSQAVDVDELQRLCDIVAGRPEAAEGVAIPILGGLAARAACSSLLAAALPPLLRGSPRALQLLLKGVDACESFAAGLCAAELSVAPAKSLWKALLSSAKSMKGESL